MTDPILASIWRKYRECSAFARTNQAKYNNLRLAALVLTVLGSVTAAVADQLKLRHGPVEHVSHSSPEFILGIASALLLAVAAFMAQRLLTGKQATEWVTARAVAEALKSEAFRYAAAIGAYTDPATRAAQLFKRKAELEAPAAALSLPTVTDEDAVKDLPPSPLGAEAYVKDRAGEQEGWYRRRADDHRKTRGQWETASLMLALAAIVIGAVRAFFDEHFIAGWLTVLGGIGASIAAHVAAQRYKAIEDGYRAAANGLREQIDLWGTVAGPDKESVDARTALVTGCEGVMRTENGSWMSEWLTEKKSVPPTSPAPGAPMAANP